MQWPRGRFYAQWAPDRRCHCDCLVVCPSFGRLFPTRLSVSSSSRSSQAILTIPDGRRRDLRVRCPFRPRRGPLRCAACPRMLLSLHDQILLSPHRHSCELTSVPQNVRLSASRSCLARLPGALWTAKACVLIFRLKKVVPVHLARTSSGCRIGRFERI